jgi:aldehyde:ferredoxin oxidoreductase
MTLFGYHGAYLRIDVTDGRAERVPLAESLLRQYIGGSGLGARLLLDEGGAAADPLSPEAPLVFAFSPLVGSPLTTSAKFAVVSRSPLTERFNDSLASSGFALAGKRAGCDAIVVVGRARALSVLVIDDGEIRLEPADDVRGDACPTAEEKLRARLGADYRIASIGPAGERGVRYATISHDGRHAGRGGSGAVLGAKNIKAIAVRGRHRCDWAHPQELVALSRDLSTRSFGPATAKYRELGTATNLLTFNRFGALPTRNFQSGTFEEAPSLAPEQLGAAHARTRSSCVACTIGCEHIYALGKSGVRVEYESLFALGSLCGVSDGDAVLRASRRCDELGIDTISAGGTIAFAMECVERGLLDEPWLTFGSGDAVLTAIDLVGRGEGRGSSWPRAAGARRRSSGRAASRLRRR